MTCTVTMPSEKSAEIRCVGLVELARADYQFPTPFIIELEQGEFFAEKLVRLIPKRRMVVFGSWRGVPAVAKIFFDRIHAVRHLTAEVTGIKVMQENKIPTPELLYSGPAADQGIQILICEQLTNANDLDMLWSQRESDESLLPTLQAVMIEVATQHVLGVLQRDMHLGNFLVTDKVIYTIDGAQIEAKPALIGRKESMENLALLISQLGAGVDGLKHALFLHYARARGWLLKPADTREMQFQIKKSDVDRWQRYGKKIFRASTDFIELKRLGWKGMAQRRYLGDELQAFIKNPDAVFSKPETVMLKDGRSSTVVKANFDGQELVIKRYNMKNAWHRMRRMLRYTRAQRSWRLAQKLCLFNVNTALPVAYLESNWLGVRGKSYFVMKYIPGNDVKSYLAEFEQEPYAAANVMQRVANLLMSLTKLDVTHGDLKATNIIINEHGHPYLIDLDGAIEHLSLAGLHRAWRSERKRFMRNFEDLPAISEVLNRLMRSHHSR